jgi:hypothetical protein
MNPRIPAVLSALPVLLALLCGCTKKTIRTAGTPDNVLSYGIYTATTLDSGLSVKLSLNQTNTYSKKKFQGSCFIIEYKGDWTCDNASVDFHLTDIRQRPDCNTEDWRSDKVDKHTRRLIRSVTVTSFELLDQDDQSSDEWVKFVKR